MTTKEIPKINADISIRIITKKIIVTKSKTPKRKLQISLNKSYKTKYL